MMDGSIFLLRNGPVYVCYFQHLEELLLFWRFNTKHNGTEQTVKSRKMMFFLQDIRARMKTLQVEVLKSGRELWDCHLRVTDSGVSGLVAGLGWGTWCKIKISSDRS